MIVIQLIEYSKNPVNISEVFLIKVTVTEVFATWDDVALKTWNDISQKTWDNVFLKNF
jgi:hypothetical protein